MTIEDGIANPGDDGDGNNRSRTDSPSRARNPAAGGGASTPPCIFVHGPHAAAAVEVPVLAFGLYKVPTGDEGVRVVEDAVRRAGYRHLDCASIYGNEETVGRALAGCLGESGTATTTTTTAEGNPSTTSSNTGSPPPGTLRRSDLFVASKVWNDAQRAGRSAVRKSVERSLEDLGLEYLDICYVHWPVPGCFVETYRELLLLRKRGFVRFLGISNFRIADYEELVAGIPPAEFVPPLIHQFEVSPFLYRPEIVDYFRETRGILVAASKALHRTAGLDGDDGAVVRDIAASHAVTPAQVLLRWSVQKNMIVLSKTDHLPRMIENRDLFGFSLSTEDMDRLDGITTEEAIRARTELEAKRRTG